MAIQTLGHMFQPVGEQVAKVRGGGLTQLSLESLAAGSLRGLLEI